MNKIIELITANPLKIGVFPYGPNNQMRGFRDTITLAIKLNRTVVLPKFFMHRTERDAIEESQGDSDEDNPLSYWSVSAHRKIDVNKLKSLVKTVTLREFSKQCSKGNKAYLSQGQL